MKKKFCPRCGKETEELVDSLCRDCFTEKKDWVEIPDKVTVKVCQGCGRKKVKNWRDLSLEEALERKLEKKVSSPGKVKGMDIKLDDDKERAAVKLYGSFKDVDMEEEKSITIRIEEELCEGCKKIKTGYFEAKVQIRTEDVEVEKILDDCEKILKERGSDEVMVSGLEERKNGFDIFMASNSAAKYLAKKLAERYKVDRKNTKTLKGLRDGNKAYRSTYLVRVLKDIQAQ